jgi:ribose transport system substrate-binding protein
MNRSDTRSPLFGAQRLALALLVIGAAFALAACGGSSSSSSAGGSESSGESPESSSKGVEEATAAIKPFEKTPTSIGITEPLKEIPKNANFAFVQCEVPQCTVIGDYMEPAAKTMGVNLERINAGNTPESFQRGFTVALQKEPDAIIVPALDPVLYPEQLKEIEEKHIPLIIWTIPEEAGGAITANLVNNAEYARNGRLMADYAISKSEGKGNVLYVTVPEYTVFKTQAAAYEKEMEERCPSCGGETVSVTIQEVGKGLPGRIVSYLQQHPETEWIVGAFGSVMAGVPEAMQAAGISGVESLTQAGPPETMQYLKEGKQTADLSLDIPVLAWKALDAAARAVVGQPVSADAENPVPIQFLTQEDITFDPEAGWQPLPHFEEEFEELWGVG